jgi:hypothetical protein
MSVKVYATAIGIRTTSARASAFQMQSIKVYFFQTTSVRVFAFWTQRVSSKRQVFL